MTTVTADDKFASVLTSGDTLVEVRDAAGVVIGFFAPVRLEYAEQYAVAAAKAYSTGVLRRPKTTPEVLAQLESMELAK